MIEVVAPNDEHEELLKYKFQVELLKKKLSKPDGYVTTEELKWILGMED